MNLLEIFYIDGAFEVTMHVVFIKFSVEGYLCDAHKLNDHSIKLKRDRR